MQSTYQQLKFIWELFQPLINKNETLLQGEALGPTSTRCACFVQDHERPVSFQWREKEWMGRSQGEGMGRKEGGQAVVRM